jgi:hypothetical protein
LAKTYGWTDDYIRKGITGAKGWVYANWARENEMTVFGAIEERKSDGYVAQERRRILADGK